MRVVDISNRLSAAEGPADGQWVEVMEPLADAMNIVSTQLLQEPTSLAGVSIAVTERGTLMLNALAWALFAESLRALSGLRTKNATLDDVMAVRFLL
jgi:hypothetical protein